MARTNAFYGQGSGPINIDDPGCGGNELRLIDCPFSPIHNCGHSEDAGVDCNPTSMLMSIANLSVTLLSLLKEFVKKEMLDFKEAGWRQKVVWRSASMRLGALSVITAGLSMMPMLSANSWDSLILVN